MSDDERRLLKTIHRLRAKLARQQPLVDAVAQLRADNAAALDDSLPRVEGLVGVLEAWDEYVLAERQL